MIDLRYNKYKKCLIQLNEGEEFCKYCKGDGLVPPTEKIRRGKTYSLVCKVCMGDGKIDWIEKAVGKRKKVIDECQQKPSL